MFFGALSKQSRPVAQTKKQWRIALHLAGFRAYIGNWAAHGGGKFFGLGELSGSLAVGVGVLHAGEQKRIWPGGHCFPFVFQARDYRRFINRSIDSQSMGG